MLKINKIHAFFRNNHFAILGLFVTYFIAVFFRTYTLSENLLFGMEQGRDALKTQGIYQLKDIALIGPKTDVDGIFHGVWYYYLLAVVYFFVNGNPIHAAYVMTLIGSLTGFFVYWIARELGLNKNYSLLAALLSAVSYNHIIYSRWLSNVSPSIPIVSVFFLLTIKLIKSKGERYWMHVLASAALLFHFELLHGLYAIVSLSVFVLIFRLKMNVISFFRGVLVFFLIQTPFIVFELKNNFLLTKQILRYLLDSNLSQNPFAIIGLYIGGILEELALTFAAKFSLFPIFFIGVVMYFFMRVHREQKHPYLSVIFIFLFWTFPYTFLLRDYPMQHFYAGTSIMMIVALVYMLSHISLYIRHQFSWAILLCIIILMSIYNMSALRDRNGIFYHNIQKSMTIKDQLDMIDYMFAQNKSFRWESFTVPYYFDDAYRYLISWYGKKKYPHTFAKLMNEESGKTLYLIIEPQTHGEYLERWLLEKNTYSTLINEKQFGAILLQERKYL